ncbi:PLP-dependent aminotransferase family protein [Sporomusa termitida]|uniref:HTH-type transcriptional regulatory protein GabR n=1 Tax=Sporomusa termitida TaxID=2377 RepID=A0A517DP65_9FIRM|nr:PLP-dependent aminotransferase family protein [Sporomusa termitida]QDR79150.1 HTH-type transcriptional regulatory protein GabR [Sporomusa termitida]
MLELLMLNPNSKEPLYIQLYQHYKNAIEQNRIVKGEKLPSIRGLAKSLAVSKITVEKAYQQLLSEGYISNYDRSRYTVNKFEDIRCETGAATAAAAPAYQPLPAEEATILYDFASGEMDINGFDFSLWKRYISKVFLNKERLVGYGHIRGEPELRTQIAKYIQKSRGVYTQPDQIIVGAGVQNLLNILCSLLKLEHQSIAFEEPGFKNGRRIFTDHAFAIIPVKMRQDGIAIEELVKSGTKLVYLSPSHQFPTGYIMPVGKRTRLLKWAQSVDGTIIEDDYDSEFRYFGRPIPALKGLDNAGRVVYLGSFSKVIPPSIRISYLVLPEHLLALYHQNSSLYNQAASTIEQLALAKFMEDGHLERQIRRLRKLYAEKNVLLFDAIRNILGEHVEVTDTESGLHTILSVKAELTAKDLVEKALAQGCRVAPVQDYYLESSQEKLPQIILYFSKIPANQIATAIRRLHQAWFA